jgi:hypothetical protein
VAERRRRSNDGEALVAGDEVPAVLQLEEGKGECEAKLQWGTMAARVDLTGRMGRWQHDGQNSAAQGISGGSEWTEGRGEKGGCSRGPGGAGVEGGKRKGARRFYPDAQR